MSGLSAYVGRWVAVVHEHVVGVGSTAEEARHMAHQSRPKEKPSVIFVSPEVQITRAAKTYPMIGAVFDLADANGTSTYLVGGSVRDLLSGAGTHDLDFAVDGDGLALARFVADRLRGAYVPLDRERRTGRVVLAPPNSTQDKAGLRYIDFASFRGGDLDEDLADRDFTINAMALARTSDGEIRFLDPLGGSEDLAHQVLRATSPASFRRDPIRTLRAVRMQTQFGYTIEPQTRQWLQAAVPFLKTVSAERLRDEWFRILEQPTAADALQQLHQFGLLEIIAAPVAALDGLEQSSPHRVDVLTHAFETVRAVEQLWDAFQGGAVGSPLCLHDDVSALVPQLQQHYRSLICEERSYLSVLKCAALLHDTGKLEARDVDLDGRVRFIGHERLGAQIASHLARTWRCSNAETDMLRTAVEAHMRPTWLAQQPALTPRAIHRYYRDTGAYGIDAAFVALADYLATWGPDFPPIGWQRQVETVARLWSAFFWQRETLIEPPALISGHDLVALGLPPGPQIGALLARMREAQAAGEIKGRHHALALVQKWVDKETL